MSRLSRIGYLTFLPLFVETEVFFYLLNETLAKFLPPAVHRQLTGAVAAPNGEMAAPALVRFEGAFAFAEPAVKFVRIHR